MRLITDAVRVDVWFQNRRFQLARLETRTKEFIRIREYVNYNVHMRNESERCVPPTDYILRREVRV